MLPSFISPELIAFVKQTGPTLGMFVILYFLFFRPQKNAQQKRLDLLDSLKKGSRVITVGGIHGTIVDINDKTIILKVSDKVELKFLKTAVQSLQKED